MTTKPTTVGLKYMLPDERRAYFRQKQREYQARHNAKTSEASGRSLSAKAKRRLADGKRALEIKQKAAASCTNVPIRQIALRMGMSDSYLGTAMREVSATVVRRGPE